MQRFVGIYATICINGETMSLCYRCEYRAQFLETGNRPRYECGEIEKSKHGCYMYRPIKPVVLQRDMDDERPQFGPWFFSSHSYFVRIADEMKLNIKQTEEGSTIYWGFEDDPKS